MKTQKTNRQSQIGSTAAGYWRSGIARKLGWAVMFALVLGVWGCKSDSNEQTPPAAEQATDQADEAAEEYDKYAGWCHGHALPEAYCTKCHPELVDKYKEEGDWCDQHEFPLSACPECNPMDPPEDA